MTLACGADEARAAARADRIAAAAGVGAAVAAINMLAGAEDDQAEMISMGAPAALRRLAERAPNAAVAARARSLADDIEAGTAGRRGTQAPAGGGGWQGPGGMPPGCPMQ
jgi:hypothetical protein